MDSKRGIGDYLLVAVGLFFLAAIGWFFVSYNTLVKKEEATKAAWAQVESNMQRKLDLIPNLIKSIKAYTKHESQLLQEITRLRSKALNQLNSSQSETKKLATMAQLQHRLDTHINKLMAVVESYPELKSSEHFLELQSQLEGAENRINITRMHFNEAVADYNAYLRTIPANIVASIAHFAPKAYFKAKESAHKKMEIEL